MNLHLLASNTERFEEFIEGEELAKFIQHCQLIRFYNMFAYTCKTYSPVHINLKKPRLDIHQRSFFYEVSHHQLPKAMKLRSSPNLSMIL